MTKKTRFKESAFVLFLILMVTVSPSLAEQLNIFGASGVDPTKQQCTKPLRVLKNGDNTANGYDDGTPVTVFVDSNLASDFTSCGWTSHPSQILLEKFIQDAMEVWNREGRGRVFVWGGTINANTTMKSSPVQNTDTCKQIQDKFPSPAKVTPSVIIYASSDPNASGDMAVNGVGNCNGLQKLFWKTKFANTTATVTPTNDTSPEDQDPCNDANNIYGDSDSWTRTDYGATAKREHFAKLVHELGHVHGLGHRNVTSLNFGNMTSSAQSVMAQWTTRLTAGDGDDRSNIKNASDFHLWPWDQDCIDNGGRTREVTLQYINFGNDFKKTGIFEQNKIRYGKSGRMNGSFYSNNGKKVHYGAFKDDHMKLSEHVSGDGDIKLNDRRDFATTSKSYDWIDPFISPVFFDGLSSINIVTYPSIPNGVANNDMGWHYARVATSSHEFDSHIETYSFKVGSVAVTSLIPVQGVLDPVSNRYVYLRVNTKRDATTINSTDSGKMFLHSTDGSVNRLEDWGVDVTAKVAADLPAGDTYNGRVMTQPGLTCGKDWRGRGGFNCMIAWKDQASLNGRILYTHFKVDNSATDPQNRFVFRGPVYELKVKKTGELAETPGDVSVGYMNNQFWIAFKTYATGFQQNSIKVVRSKEGGYRIGGGKHYTINPSRYVVDSPGWGYHKNASNLGATLTWSVDSML